MDTDVDWSSTASRAQIYFCDLNNKVKVQRHIHAWRPQRAGLTSQINFVIK